MKKLRTLGTTKDVLEYLNITEPTLRKLMKRTPEGAFRPWLNISTGKRPLYRWHMGRIDEWVQEVQLWHTSANDGTYGRSAGGSREGASGNRSNTHAPTKLPRGSSKRRSKGASQRAGTGSLAAAIAEISALK